MFLHADLDAFYASVEQRDDPALRGKPVIVGGGVVLAASYEARAHGVRTAMNGRQAMALCPHATVVEPRMAAYSEASKAVFAVFDDTSPFVEPLSIDEAFIDVSGLGRVSGTPTEVATQLRTNVVERVGLVVTVGVARTKFLAKVASGVGKPDGLLVVDPDGEEAFLHPLPVRRLWGVGPVTAEKLNERGIETVGDIARMGEASLAAILGPASARHLHALSRNRDPRPIETGRRRRSIGSQRALGHKKRSHDELEGMLLGIVDRVATRLRKADRLTRTVVLRLRFDDMSRATRSHSLPQATDETAVLLETAQLLLAGARRDIDYRGITLIGLSLANLTNDDTLQLTLDLDGHDHRSLDTTVDDIRARFGAEAVTQSRLLGQKPALTVPLLPD